ncbi:MAG: 1,4-dihydroxy-2-naphthoate octaprenyltransferase [Candidatus Anoxychlamydiales bacterium]|nr:1,4-dihydroxy-2-naphthoate octaprenyltransferase [Candidatus Anoxychlamydiales bacterium]
MVLEKFKIWVLATRANTLVVSICPIFLGSALALKVTNINFSVFLLTLCYGLFLHIGTNLSNDYYDYLKGVDTDNRIAPFSTIQLNLTSLKEIKIAFSLSFILAFFTGLILAFKSNILVATLFPIPIFFGLYYTKGKNPLGYMGLGEILVLIFFGPFASFGSYYLQTMKFSVLPIVVGLAPGLFSTAILVVNNLRDIDCDKRAKKNTLSVRFGKNFTKVEYYICLIAIFFIPVIYFSITKNYLVLLANFAILLAPIKTIKNFKDLKVLNIALQKTVLSMILFSLIFFLGILF